MRDELTQRLVHFFGQVADREGVNNIGRLTTSIGQAEQFILGSVLDGGGPLEWAERAEIVVNRVRLGVDSLQPHVVGINPADRVGVVAELYRAGDLVSQFAGIARTTLRRNPTYMPEAAGDKLRRDIFTAVETSGLSPATPLDVERVVDNVAREGVRSTGEGRRLIDNAVRAALKTKTPNAF